METVVGIGIMVILVAAILRFLWEFRRRSPIGWREDVRVVSGYEAIETLRRAGK